MAFFWIYYLLGIFALTNIKFISYRNDTTLGGIPLDVETKPNFKFGFWYDNFGGGGGGGGGGRSIFPLFYFIFRPHPIEVFSFPELDALQASTKALNEEHYACLEELRMLEFPPGKELHEVKEDCDCRGACNCATFVPHESSDHAVSVNVRLPGSLILHELKVLSLNADRKWFWADVLKENFGLHIKDFMILIDKMPFSSSRRIHPDSTFDIIPKGHGGGKPKKEISGSTYDYTKDDTEDDSDPDHSMVDDGPIRWTDADFDEEFEATSDEEFDKTLVPVPLANDDTYDEEPENEVRVLNKISKKTEKGRRIYANSRSGIAKALAVNCCKKQQCLKAFNHEEIKEWRSYFWELSTQHQRQFILDAFSLNTYHDGSRRLYTFKINGKPTCARAWFTALGVSQGWFYGLLKEYEGGRVSGESAKVGRTWTGRRARQAVMWLKSHIESSADMMPHEDKMCLPSCQSKAEIFKMYKEDLMVSKKETISFTHFRRLWREYFRNVIIPKQNRFTKCGVCTLMKHSLESTRDEARRSKLVQKRRVHLLQQSAERNHYYGNRLKAELNPSKYLSLILDGMDQAKTNLPHVTRISKTEPSHFLRSHITGAISHGHKRWFSYIDLLRWKHDSNLTLNILLKLFVRLAKGGRLPPILLLQMDNCYRECKNKYIMAFASYLIQKEIFKEIHISYLMVGHTHEDVDQFFSRIALKLSRRNVMTVPELHDLVQAAFEPAPESEEVEHIFDISGWLKPNVVTIKNHVYPHVFRYFLASDNQAKMQYKNLADDKLWLPDEPIVILENLPGGIPQLIAPGLGGRETMAVTELQSNLDRGSSRMTNQQVDWWQQFIEKEKKMRKKWEDMTPEEETQIGQETWPLSKLKKYREPTTKSVAEQEGRQDEELDRLIDKENKFPPLSDENG